MMELLTTIPTRLVRPMNAVKEKVYPVIHKASIDPITAKGMAVNTIKG